jgi:hypothetical protein
MTDKQFQKILDTLTDAHRNYLDLLKLAEDEIIRRYGIHPSEIDNDEWIDSYHQGLGHMTIKQLDESMNLHMK